MTYEIKINSLLTGDDYPRQGETELGESFETTFPEFRNLIKQPRMCGVDGGSWTHKDISSSTEVAGYDGEVGAWRMVGEYSEQRIPNITIRQHVLSFYLAQADPGVFAFWVSDGINSDTVDINASDGTIIVRPPWVLIDSSEIGDNIDGWYRISLKITPILPGNFYIRVRPNDPVTVDAFQFERGSSVTAFVNPELAPYNKLLWKRLTCPRCGYPVKSAGEIFEQSIDGRRVEVCDRCADKE